MSVHKQCSLRIYDNFTYNNQLISITYHKSIFEDGSRKLRIYEGLIIRNIIDNVIY